MTDPELSDDLARLADLHGISTEFWDYRGRHSTASPEAVTAVLAALGVDAGSPEAIRTAITDAQLAAWRRPLPACVVTRAGSATSVPVHVPHGNGVRVEVRHEEDALRAADLPGGSVALAQLDVVVEPREVDGTLTGRATFEIPAGLPLGWFQLVAHIEGIGDVTAPLAVTPDMLEDPPVRSAGGTRGWGLMAQLYSVRSRGSWGMGDAADLGALTRLTGELGGDFVLVNPLHAAEPAGPQTPSPYLPSSRRFVNPLYIRPEAVPETEGLRGQDAAEFAQFAARGHALSASTGQIDRDASWAAKSRALEIVFAQPRSPERQAAFDAFRAELGQGIEDFALWSALVEKYQGEALPEDVASVEGAGVPAARAELAERIEYFAWLQWVVDEQLARAQRSAREAGMGMGIMHDLAVGVHPTGADTWAIPSAFASGVTVGAPPDYYNQLGQDWSQPPFRPDTLAETAYLPLRRMIGTVLRHAGALRIDHIMGFFRLWWVPAGMGPADGVYVRYDHEAMMGVLLLEAHLAGATLVGEDLGTVEPWVREYLAERGVLGTSVFWFEKNDRGDLRRPHEYRRGVLATVDTHDLPPVAGYLDEEHVDLRARLGLLVDGEDTARAAARDERERTVAALRGEGLLPDDGRGADQIDRAQLIDAIHAYVASTPSVLVAVSLTDAVGERRVQNQPGTNNEYPNWRIPLADGDGALVMVDDLPDHPRLHEVLAAVRTAI